MGRYEDQLYRKVADEATRDSNGDFIPGSVAGWTLVADCREEPSSAGQKISGVDGEDRKVSSIIQLPEDCPTINPGERIQVKDQDGNVRIEAEALRFVRYRKSCRLWV